MTTRAEARIHFYTLEPEKRIFFTKLVLKRTFLGSTKHQREGNFPKESSEPKENQIMLEKQKWRLMSATLPSPITSDSLQCGRSCSRPFIDFMLSTQPNLGLTLHVPNGLMNGTKVIFSLPCAGKLFPGCAKTYVDIWSLRLKKQQLIVKGHYLWPLLKMTSSCIILRKHSGTMI